MRFPLQVGATLALLAALAGLASRRRFSLCWSFVAYAAAILVCGNLVALWPSRFYTPEFWAVKQTVYDVAKVAVALELAWRVVRAFPGAQRSARRGVVALFAAAAALAVVFPPRGAGMMGDVHMRAVGVVVWLLGLAALVAMWYHLPIHSWHRALLLGFSAYLMVFTILLEVLRQSGWAAAAELGRLDGWAYLAVTCWWAVAAWRVERVPAGVPADVLRRLRLETP